MDKFFEQVNRAWLTLSPNNRRNVIVFLGIMFAAWITTSVASKLIELEHFKAIDLSDQKVVAQPDATPVQRMIISESYYCDEYQGGNKRFICYSRLNDGTWKSSGAY